MKKMSIKNPDLIWVVSKIYDVTLQKYNLHMYKVLGPAHSEFFPVWVANKALTYKK